MSDATRDFRVRARHEDPHHGRLVSEPSFEAAAIAYVEHLSLSAEQTLEVNIVVHDVHSGHEHSFVVHLDTGEATPVT
ncbi:DUF5961 family protein [Lichenihabitans psoromatis]|uniref:DUF5961 family protein n=1 Tax=Lichenihabitans psoromatis TaxID=2528642 RepID=UPI001035DE56|nr:DUF5961 family protein [Lichenihabitans psoromatis]